MVSARLNLNSDAFCIITLLATIGGDSGRRHMLGKRVTGNTVREFESRLLRQFTSFVYSINPVSEISDGKMSAQVIYAKSELIPSFYEALAAVARSPESFTTAKISELRRLSLI